MKKIKGFFGGKDKSHPSAASGATGSSNSVNISGYDIREKDLPKIHKAAWTGDLAKVKQLAKKDASPFDKENRTPLHLACVQGHANVAQELLEWHAKTNVGDNQAKTPLMKAVECNQDECVRLLIEFRVEVDAIDRDGNTALHLAVREGFAIIAASLIHGGANLNQKNRMGYTPLHLSVLDTSKRDDLTRLLLKNDADPNVVDTFMRTPLHHACIEDSLSQVKLLLQKGVNTAIKDAKGWTAEDCAMMKGHHGSSQLVFDHCLTQRRAIASSVPSTPRGPSQPPSSQTTPRERTDSSEFGMPAPAGEEDESGDETLSKASAAGDRHLDSWADDTDISSTEEHKKKAPVKISLTKNVHLDSDDERGASEKSETHPPPRPGSDSVRTTLTRIPTPDSQRSTPVGMTPPPKSESPVFRGGVPSKIPVRQTLSGASQTTVEEDWSDGDETSPQRNHRVSFKEDQDVRNISAEDDTDVDDDIDEIIECKKRRIETPDEAMTPPVGGGYTPTGAPVATDSSLSKDKQKEFLKSIGLDGNVSDVSDPNFSEASDVDIKSPREESQAPGSEPRQGILKNWKPEDGKPPSNQAHVDSDFSDSDDDTTRPKDTQIVVKAEINLATIPTDHTTDHTFLADRQPKDEDSDWDSTKHSESNVRPAKLRQVIPGDESGEYDSDLEKSLNPDHSIGTDKDHTGMEKDEISDHAGSNTPVILQESTSTENISAEEKLANTGELDALVINELNETADFSHQSTQGSRSSSAALESQKGMTVIAEDTLDEGKVRKFRGRGPGDNHVAKDINSESDFDSEDETIDRIEMTQASTDNKGELGDTLDTAIFKGQPLGEIEEIIEEEVGYYDKQTGNNDVDDKQPSIVEEYNREMEKEHLGSSDLTKFIDPNTAPRCVFEYEPSTTEADSDVSDSTTFDTASLQDEVIETIRMTKKLRKKHSLRSNASRASSAGASDKEVAKVLTVETPSTITDVSRNLVATQEDFRLNSVEPTTNDTADFQVSFEEETSQWDSTDDMYTPRTPRDQDILGAQLSSPKVGEVEFEDESNIEEFNDRIEEAMTSFITQSTNVPVKPSPSLSVDTPEPKSDSTPPRSRGTPDPPTTSGSVSVQKTVIQAVVEEPRARAPMEEDDGSDWDSEDEVQTDEETPRLYSPRGKDLPRPQNMDASPRTPRGQTSSAVSDEESISEWEIERQKCTSFLQAAKDGDLTKLLEHLNNDAGIVNARNSNGLAALHVATMEGHLNVVRELLRQGADWEVTTKKGYTALHIASQTGHVDIVKLLVANDAKINIQSQDGVTPLDIAAQEGHAAVVQFLAANGARHSLTADDDDRAEQEQLAEEQRLQELEEEELWEEAELLRREELEQQVRQEQWDQEEKQRQEALLREAQTELEYEQDLESMSSSSSSSSSKDDSDDEKDISDKSENVSQRSQPSEAQVKSQKSDVSERSRPSSQRSDPPSLTSSRPLLTRPPKLVVTHFVKTPTSPRNPVKMGEIENESPIPVPEDQIVVSQDARVYGAPPGYGAGPGVAGMYGRGDVEESDDDVDDIEEEDDIVGDEEVVEEVVEEVIQPLEEQRVKATMNGYGPETAHQELSAPDLPTAPPPLLNNDTSTLPAPAVTPAGKPMSAPSDGRSVGVAEISHSPKQTRQEVLSYQFADISATSGAFMSGLDVPFDDDGLSVTSTENDGDISSSYKPDNLPYGKDMLVNMNLTDSGAVIKLQEHLREHRRQLEHERGQKMLLENKYKILTKDKKEMQKRIDSLGSQKSTLEQCKLDLEANIRNLEYNVNEESEKRRNSEIILQKTKDHLAKKEEQFTLEMESKQRAELSMRNVQLELRSTQNQVKELDEEKDEIERLLSNEKNARQLQEKINDEQQKLQLHLNEESVKTHAQKEDVEQTLELADDDIKQARDRVEKYKNEIVALKVELQRQRVRLTEENTMLTGENEKLQLRVDDLRNEVKLNEEALTQVTVQQNMQLSNSRSEAAMLGNSLDKERVVRDKIDADLESVKNRLQATTIQLEKAQQARNDLERRLHSDREEWARHLDLKDKELTNSTETTQTLLHKLNATETKLNAVENELHISNTTLLERTTQHQQTQRDLQYYKTAQDNFDSNMRHEKEQNAKLIGKIESLQDRLSALQHENLSMKQQLDGAQAMAKDRSGADLHDKLNAMMANLKVENDKGRASLEEKNLTLQDTISRLKDDGRNSENRRSNLEQDLRKLNQEYNELVRKLSIAEASLDVAVKARDSLDQERGSMRLEIEKLQQKYHSAQEKTIESQTKMGEMVGRLDKAEQSRILSSQQLADTSATMQAFSSSKEEFKEEYQKLQVDNVRVDAELKHEKQKSEQLQRDLADSQKVRSSLEALCSNLKSTNAHLEDKLGPEQLKHVTQSDEVNTRGMIVKDAEESKDLWEKEVISRSKLGLRIAQLDRHKQEAASQLEEEKRKARKAQEQRKVFETKLETEHDKSNQLQKEVANLKAYLKVAKKKLKDTPGGDDALDSNDSRFNNLHTAFDRERIAMEEMLVSVKSQLEHMKLQMQDETTEKEKVHQKYIALEQELKTVKKLEVSVKKLDRSKKKLEDEFSLYKNNVETGYTDKATVEESRKELETRYRHELNRKLDEVNNYLEEQARTRHRLDSSRDEQDVKLRKDKMKFEEECTDLRVRLEQSTAQKETKELEVKRYRDLYESEMQWRMRLSEQLYKSTDKAFGYKNNSERQRNRMYGSMNNVSMNGHVMDISRISGTLMDDPLSNKLKAELDRSIAKHLEAAPHDQIRPVIREEDISSSNFAKSNADYIAILKHKYCV